MSYLCSGCDRLCDEKEEPCQADPYGSSDPICPDCFDGADWHFGEWVEMDEESENLNL